jgi:uncharacterized membrane protein
MATTDETGSGTQTGTETGLDENLLGALAYLFGWLSGLILFFVEGDNDFVKFHAAQSIVFNIALIPIFFALMIFNFILGFISDILGLLFSLVWFGVAIAGFAATVYLMYKAYSHEEFEIPVIGGFARSLAS